MSRLTEKVAPRSRQPRRSLPWRLVGTILIVLELVAIPGTIRQAAANPSTEWIEIGDQVLSLSDGSAPASLVINGVSLRLMSGSSELPYSDLLDRFRDRCRTWSGIQLPNVARRLASAAGSSGGALTNDLILDPQGVIRLEGKERGIVACLDTNSKKLEAPDLVNSALRFARTGDLRAFGQLRYFFAKRTEENKSVYLAAWTDGEVNLLQMFPAKGDAPGGDLVDLPRPSNGRRRLSVSEATQRLGFVSYSVGKDEGDIVRFRTNLSQLGWDLVETESEERKPAAFVAKKATRQILVISHEALAERWITIVELQAS